MVVILLLAYVFWAGVVGVWGALVAGYVVMMIIVEVKIHAIDWDQAVLKVKKELKQIHHGDDEESEKLTTEEYEEDTKIEYKDK